MSETCICRTEKEYKAAIKKKERRIRIADSELARKTKLILAIPAASFVLAAAFAIAAIAAVHWGIVAFAAAPVTGGASAIGGAVAFGAGGTTMVPIMGLVGIPTAIALVSLGAAIGGIGAIKTIYNEYKIIESGPNFILLERK
ncbi:MAG: hypothetical protein WCF33_15195 [Pseudonocardiaceae bacterium]